MTLETLIITALVLVVVVPLLASTVVVTRQQNVRLIETFGRFSSIRSAGLSFKLPWPIQIAGENFSLKIQEIAEDVTVKSKDNAFVSVPIRVQYRVNEHTAQDAFYKLSNAADQIRSYVVNQVRSTASGMTFNDLFQSRNTFENDVASTLTERMGEFGFRIENVLVDDPQPSAELRKAFDRVISAERLKEAAVNEGEAKRTLQVAEANAEGEALKIKAAAFASFRKTVAEGNAEALESFAGRTGLSAADGLAFFVSINEMEAVRDAAQAGGRIVFVSSSARDYQQSAMMGMISDNATDTPELPWRKRSGQ
jgi:regulator of protease activity HflC (stomatin/prohibitin superfamily)